MKYDKQQNTKPKKKRETKNKHRKTNLEKTHLKKKKKKTMAVRGSLQDDEKYEASLRKAIKDLLLDPAFDLLVSGLFDPKHAVDRLKSVFLQVTKAWKCVGEAINPLNVAKYGPSQSELFSFTSGKASKTSVSQQIKKFPLAFPGIRDFVKLVIEEHSLVGHQLCTEILFDISKKDDDKIFTSAAATTMFTVHPELPLPKVLFPIIFSYCGVIDTKKIVEEIDRSVNEFYTTHPVGEDDHQNNWQQLRHLHPVLAFVAHIGSTLHNSFPAMCASLNGVVAKIENRRLRNHFMKLLVVATWCWSLHSRCYYQWDAMEKEKTNKVGYASNYTSHRTDPTYSFMAIIALLPAGKIYLENDSFSMNLFRHIFPQIWAKETNAIVCNWDTPKYLRVLKNMEDNAKECAPLYSKVSR